jgi:putative DNA primase/helicase
MGLANSSAGSPTSYLEYALYYSSMGWQIFPAHTIRNGRCSCGKSCRSPGKHPMTRNGLKDATTDRSQILKWWNKAPDANIAIRTGKETDLLVLDIDTKSNGFDSLETLENTFYPLPSTLTSITGSNGRHFCFKHPGGKIKTQSRVLDGIDIRADGGYIIAPPSRHISGHTYRWGDIRTKLVEPPEWLLGLLNDPDKPSSTDREKIILEGSRNSTLMSLAGLKWSQNYSRSKLKTYLLEENTIRCSPPLEYSEVIDIFERVTSYQRGERNFIFTWRERFMSSRLPSNSKLLLHTLSCHMDSSGRSCYPTQEQIGKEASMNLKTVRAHIKICVDTGWIKKYRHTSGEQEFWNYGYIAKLPDG